MGMSINRGSFQLALQDIEAQSIYQELIQDYIKLGEQVLIVIAS